MKKWYKICQYRNPLWGKWLHLQVFLVKYIVAILSTQSFVAMLGQASNEVFKRSVINSEYKDLCSRNQPVPEFLLGHNLPQGVKELDLTNKLGSRPKNKYSYFRNKSHGNKRYHKQSSSLGRG